MTSTDVVPFGKHKGQPIEVLLADPGYSEWLLAQPWFREKYTTIYQTIVNYGGEPVETPEHNELQATFLTDERCLGLARVLCGTDLFDGSASMRRIKGAQYNPFKDHLDAKLWPAEIDYRQFEVSGWDVVYMFSPAAWQLTPVSFPECLCWCDHENDCPGSSQCRGGEEEHRCQHRDHERRSTPIFEEWKSDPHTKKHHYTYYHCNKECPWRDSETTSWFLDNDQRFYMVPSRKVRVECKPDLGDDFPAVLRQVTRYDAQHGDVRVVLVRRAAFQSVSWEQVVQIFQASDVRLLRESVLLDDVEEVDA